MTVKREVETTPEGENNLKKSGGGGEKGGGEKGGRGTLLRGKRVSFKSEAEILTKYDPDPS